jgi:predicted acetyltransferase
MAGLRFGSRLQDEAEAQALKGVLEQCFQVGGWDTFFRRIGPENFRVLRRGRKPAAGLAIYRMGQWFGGRSVPMAGIAAVGVPPEARGQGLAERLVAETLKGLHAEGTPLSALYPSTYRLYRKVGYEQAGFRCHYSIEVQNIGVRDRMLEMRPVELAGPEALRPLYERLARSGNGLLDRNAAIWERTLLPRSGEVKRAYLIGPPGREEGYVVFHQPEASGPGLYDLLVSDRIALSGSAQRRLWSFFADHSSLGGEVRWFGPPAEPALFVLPEPRVRLKRLELWMLRILDVRRALELRGYPQAWSQGLDLEVRDELLPRNNGRFVLEVQDGAAQVRKGGRGRLKLDVRALAALYSGLHGPHELHALGCLEGTRQALAEASGLFAGPKPWMPDGF